jgi:hypothetical protein
LRSKATTASSASPSTAVKRLPSGPMIAEGIRLALCAGTDRLSQ